MSSTPRQDAGYLADPAASAPAAAPGLSDRGARLLLLYTPVGRLVRAVARLRSSVHFKLLAGFMLVALLVAVMGAMSSVFNSASTLVTLDFYKKLRPEASEKQLVNFGRIATG